MTGPLISSMGPALDGAVDELYAALAHIESLRYGPAGMPGASPLETAQSMPNGEEYGK